MEASTNYQQVTVDVPEDRIAEFHAFFARFLAGRTRRGHRHHGRGRRCGEHRGQREFGQHESEQRETQQPDTQQPESQPTEL